MVGADAFGGPVDFPTISSKDIPCAKAHALPNKGQLHTDMTRYSVQ